MTETKLNPMKKRITQLTLLAFFAIGSLSIQAQNTVMVGGEKMYPMKNIVENAVNSKDHTTLVAAVKAAGLVETLQGDGPIHRFCSNKRCF